MIKSTTVKKPNQGTEEKTKEATFDSQRCILMQMLLSPYRLYTSLKLNLFSFEPKYSLCTLNILYYAKSLKTCSVFFRSHNSEKAFCVK